MSLSGAETWQTDIVGQERANRSDALQMLRRLTRFERTANLVEQWEREGPAPTTREALRRERAKYDYERIVGITVAERHEVHDALEHVARYGNVELHMAIHLARERFRNGLESRDDVGWTSFDVTPAD